MEKLIIFGGTFDPIHNAHLRVASYASLKLNADVIFLPAKSPRWKAPHASINERYEMLKLALKDLNVSSLTISDYEMKSNDEINYTVDTLEHFKKLYPTYQLYLLIGADQVAAFDKWKDAARIAELAKIIYVNRPDIVIKSENVAKFKMDSLTYDKSGAASSHSIRHLNGLDTTYSVIQYIEKHELYYIKLLKDKYYTEKRFKHALSVANLAYKIAIANKIDPAQCYIAGLLHDLGKKVDEDKMRLIMQKYYSEYYHQVPATLYHQFVGAYIAKNELGITDEVVLDAITYHATGKAHMPTISKIVYAADKLDPLRDYDSSKLIKGCMDDIDAGFYDVLAANREHLIKHQLSFDNPLTKKCMELYLGK
ncbi:MAG: nicotinate (nicotinamide) nucleotide adenylyltransferase [Bacilli bacterium]|nr:nicotinate (nicotinamide) nucleotide adenylyltransferase [Bacilli bacterium]